MLTGVTTQLGWGIAQLLNTTRQGDWPAPGSPSSLSTGQCDRPNWDFLLHIMQFDLRLGAWMSAWGPSLIHFIR